MKKNFYFILTNLIFKYYNKYCSNREHTYLYADMAELVDAQDLKSCGSDTVPVRFRVSAPMTYLFELTDRLKIIQVSWMIFFFAQKNIIQYPKKKGWCLK